MKNITVILDKLESEKIWACLMCMSKDYEIQKYKHEIEHGQDDIWQALKTKEEFYYNLAQKFKQ